MDLVQADIRNMKVEPEHVFTSVMAVGKLETVIFRNVTQFVAQLHTALKRGVYPLTRFRNESDGGWFRYETGSAIFSRFGSR